MRGWGPLLDHLWEFDWVQLKYTGRFSGCVALCSFEASKQNVADISFSFNGRD